VSAVPYPVISATSPSVPCFALSKRKSWVAFIKTVSNPDESNPSNLFTHFHNALQQCNENDHNNQISHRNHPLSNCCEKQVQPRHENNHENSCEQITAVKRSKQTKFHHRNFLPVLMDYEKSHQTILTGHEKREKYNEYPPLNFLQRTSCERFQLRWCPPSLR
jgi:hypothetical protein